MRRQQERAFLHEVEHAHVPCLWLSTQTDSDLSLSGIMDPADETCRFFLRFSKPPPQNVPWTPAQSTTSLPTAIRIPQFPELEQFLPVLYWFWLRSGGSLSSLKNDSSPAVRFNRTRSIGWGSGVCGGYAIGLCWAGFGRGIQKRITFEFCWEHVSFFVEHNRDREQSG